MTQYHNPLKQNKIKQLIAELKHKDYHIRYRAVRTLGETGDERFVGPLLEALGDFDTRDEESKVNRSAMFALVHIGEAAIIPLIKALDRNPQHLNDGWRRYWVTQTLRIVKDKRAVEPLIRVLEDDDKEAIEGAAEALGEMGDTRAIEPLTKVGARPEISGYVLIAVSRAIKQLGGNIKSEANNYLTQQGEISYSDGNGYKVLIVCDDSIDGLFIKKVLTEKRGDKVKLASYSNQVLIDADKDPPNLIIISEHNPIEIYQSVREKSILQNIPVLFWRVNSPELATEAQQLGVAGYLSIPFTPEELVKARDTILTGRTYYPEI